MCLCAGGAFLNWSFEVGWGWGGLLLEVLVQELKHEGERLWLLCVVVRLSV